MSAGGVDLVVIGAGPAGMTAAAVAAEGGARVLLLDGHPAPGGQIYRGVTGADARLVGILGDDYGRGREVAERFVASGALYEPGAVVWHANREGEIAYSAAGRSVAMTAPRLALATGALERPFPVPGWTLPGAMTAGAGQILLKTSGLAAEGAVFCGTGPLLYLVAAQYLRAGVNIAAVLDTTAGWPLGRAGRHLPAALRRMDLLRKGRDWLRALRRGGVPVISGVADLRIEGVEAVEAAAYKRHGEDWRRISTGHVFLHQGVAPNINLSMAIGLDHAWDADQLSWRPRVDDWGRTSAANIFAAGDGAGIVGALASAAAGELAALESLRDMARLTAAERDARAGPARRVLSRERRVRPFLDAWFRPADRFRAPSDPGTVVCRCEALTAGDIEAAMRHGLGEPNQVKNFARSGMGPCQGRCCGLTVQALLARESGRPEAEVGYFRLRPPVKPIGLAEMAAIAARDADDAA